MGTKNNPGAYDCYAAAAPDEPMFILLARDPIAPLLVDLWAAIRDAQGCADHPHRTHDKKIAEARECANTMREYRAAQAKRDNDADSNNQFNASR